jgi:hypothetical protein
MSRTPAELAAALARLTGPEQAALARALAERRAAAKRKVMIERNRARWTADPVAWTQERLREHVWSMQGDVMRALIDHRRVAVRSAHGVGKSHLASRVAAWWLDVYPPDEAFVVTSAPTMAQVRAILWRYIRQAHRRGDLRGRINTTEWHIDGDLVGIGRKPSDYDEGAFQGIHALRVLVILDEAGGIEENLWVAADTLAVNADCRVLAIGNPDDPGSHFRHVCDSALWHQVKISAFDTPNFTGERVPDDLAKVLISVDWQREKEIEWGADSPLYISKILAEFPKDDPGKVVRWSHLAACRRPRDDDYLPEQLLPVELGVDVAGGGSDSTVIRERRGLLAGREWEYREDDSEVVARRIVDAVVETAATTVRIDSTGIGWGIVGLVRKLLREAKSRCHVEGVNAAAAPSAAPIAATDGRPAAGFLNARAEMWWTVRELARTGSIDLSNAANADTLCAQLAEPTWSINAANGKIVIEPKDEVKRRLGRSPDNADAALLAFYGATGQGSGFAEAWKRLAESDRARSLPARSPAGGPSP